jgi:tellurite resistance protein TerC
MDLADAAGWGALVVLLGALFAIDLKVFARGREPAFREGVRWSVGWLLVALAAAVPVWALSGPADAGSYVTVYLIERTLSLDNLFVFLLLFAYFGIPVRERSRLLFWGIAAALVLRAAAILSGVALLERFEFLIYVLGLALLLLAYRMFRGVAESVDPDRNLIVRLIRRLYPVHGDVNSGRWFVREAGRRHATPLLLCLAMIVLADVAFAVDSIPAAFAITRDPLLIWMGNAFALLGLRALFVLVDGLVRRFRYMRQTVALVLVVVAAKLLAEDAVHVPALVGLIAVVALLAGGLGASVLADRRDEAKPARVARERRRAGDGATRTE